MLRLSIVSGLLHLITFFSVSEIQFVPTKRLTADVPIEIAVSRASDVAAAKWVDPRKIRPRIQPMDIDGNPSSPEIESTSPSTQFLELRDILALGNESPEYPDEAEENGWEGDVELGLVTDDSGHVIVVEVITPSHYQLLDDTAVRAAKRWVLPPPRRRHQVTVSFQLEMAS